MKKKTNAEIAQLYANVGKLITSSIELDEVLDGIMEEIELFFHPAYWSLFRYDEAASNLFFQIVKGINSNDVENVKLNLGEGIAGHVAIQKKPIIVADTSRDKRFSGTVDSITGFQTKSIIGVPCIRRDKLYGVIELINEETESFAEEDRIILTTIADFAAIAFENALLYEEALHRSYIDPLTGLYNNTKLKELEEQHDDSARHNRKSDEKRILVAFMDCNNFKDINDTYGHRAGDRMLKKIASSLRKTFRQTDTLIRTGGDEFTAVIEVENRKQADELEKVLSRRLSSLVWKTKDSRCTVSLAYGFAQGKSHSLRKILHAADVKMYNNKSGIKAQDEKNDPVKVSPL